jgi:hypothetical protein
MSSVVTAQARPSDPSQTLDSETGTNGQRTRQERPNTPLRQFNQECNAVVQDYRDGTCSREGAMERIVDRVFQQRKRHPLMEVFKPSLVYFGMINKVNSEGAQAATGGGGRAARSDESRKDPEVRATRVIVPQKRGHETPEDDFFQPPARVDLSLFPSEKEEPIDRQRELQVARTRRIQVNFARDPEYAQSRILRNPRRPAFPRSLWGEVIANDYVDLNDVFDYHFSTDGAKRYSYEVGEPRLVLKSPLKVEQQIHSAEDWGTAWIIYQRAVLFLYPHRERELSEYASHIFDMFINFPAVPDRVLLYDKRVRSRTAREAGRRLSDFAEFYVDLSQIVVLNAIPGLFRESQPSGRPARDRSSEICRRYNRGLHHDPVRCRYQHICMMCREKGHIGLVCGRGARDGTACEAPQRM